MADDVEQANQTPTQAEQEAAHAARQDDPAAHVRGWLLEARSATLCTLSAHQDLDGYPFGSIVPFALTAEGRPVILIADIAAHTKNLTRDPRATLFVHQPGLEDDPQTGWRVGLSGRFVRVGAAGDKKASLHLDEHALRDLDARYAERVPAAAGYRATHDFDFWMLHDVARIRYIAGFGKICWLPGDAALRDPAGAGLGAAQGPSIAHMNEDHRGNMIEMCRGLRGFAPADAEMVSLDRTGFVVRTTGPDRLEHFSFGREIDAKDVRPAIIAVLQAARAAAPG